MTAARTPKLHRTTFKTSRLLDFCSEHELAAQIGHGRKDWARVLVKELVDNSLDSCEEAGVAPKIDVLVKGNRIVVQDNGPGIPPETIQGIIDYQVRVSSREAYCSPTRGQQGNALKIVLALPFVLDGERGRVEILAQEKRHEITFAVDRIRQQPVLTWTAFEDRDVKNGTCVRVEWPDRATSELQEAKAGFLQIADDYTLLNPHLTLVVDWEGERTVTKATNPRWHKWLPSDPTCPHWYTPEAFGRLVGAYVAHDRNRGADRPARQLLAEFRGLTATAKQKLVLEETGLARTPLSALADGDDLRHDLVGKLLEAMRRHTKPVKPSALGSIGREHLARRFADLGCEPGSFQYKRIARVDDDGLPVVIETAFGWLGDDSPASRRIVVGLNWSPGIVNPFRTLGKAYGDGLAALLESQYAGQAEPIVFLCHAACPRMTFTDRGKSALAMR